MLLGCGGDGGSSPTEAVQHAYVGGDWNLEGTVTGGSAAPAGLTWRGAAQLDQDGQAVGGAWVLGDGAGTVAGTVNGRTLTFRLTQSVGCTGSGEGSATVDSSGTSWSGSYSSSTSCGTVRARIRGWR